MLRGIEGEAGRTADIEIPHILVVDDNPDDVRTIIQAMRRAGWKVSAANDARQGLQRALVLRPDLVLLDLQMPHMDGFTFCRLLREADGLHPIPVIFLSSAGSLDNRLKGFQVGGGDYVLKPCDPKEVIARIRVHLHLNSSPSTEAAALAEGPAITRNSNSEDQLLLRAAMRLINDNLGELPSLAEIAQRVGTYDKRLSRLFREHMGTTVFAYVRELRLRKSQQLLAESEMSVQDIADWVGYGSACNFTTAFRHKIGVTPTEFRQQAKDVTVE